mmetsp:Transcript_26108/g.34288  ORF Transcript_26108/g.34288 Transcript_26108/m.34288 type:complete len:391 (-) Transcript_26108:378-1550(-)
MDDLGYLNSQDTLESNPTVSPFDAQSFVSSVGFYVVSYNWQICLVAFLYTVTVFRKKLSSNSVYYVDEDKTAKNFPSSREKIAQNRRRRRELSICTEDQFWQTLNTSLVEEMTSYLNPGEIYRFSQANRTSQKLCERGQIWKFQWKNRFGHIENSATWKECLARWNLNWNSGMKPAQGWKYFFFEFQASWVNLVTAGQDTDSQCLIGIEGAVYNVTNFIDDHPGSPETLLVNAGKDATDFFNEVGHSKSARQMMKNFVCLSPRGKLNTVLPSQLAGLSGLNLDHHSTLSLHLPRELEESLCLNQKANAILADDSPALSRFTNRCSFHLGKPRMIYVPMCQKWACLWTCCKHAEWVDFEMIPESVRKGYAATESPLMSCVRKSIPNLIRFV